MSSYQREKDELFELMQRFHDENLGDDQLSRLDELLSIPELGVEAAALLDTQSGLRDAVRTSRLIEDGVNGKLDAVSQLLVAPRRGLPVSGSTFQTWSLVSYAVAILLLSNLLVGGIVWYAQSDRVAVNSQSSEESSLPSIKHKVATQLVSMTACVWSPSDAGDPAIGRSISAGETVHLLEGIAELDFERDGKRQARIRLEGPGSLYTGVDGLLKLNFGVMSADVSWGGAPFSIETPSGKVMVRGNASVGIVSNSPQHEVHVLRGDAAIETFSHSGSTSLVHLTQGEAASFDLHSSSETGVTLFEASSASFASARSMAFDRLNIGQAYRDAVIESAPAIYWQFEDAGDEGIPNAGSIEGFNAYVDGSVTWRQFGENRAAEFGLTGTVGSFTSKQKWPAKPLDSYTIELWAKPSHFHNGALICLVAPPKNAKNIVMPRLPHGMFVEFGGQLGRGSVNPLLNNVRFVHRSVPSNNRLDGTAASASGGYRARSWQHVVARKNGDQLELMINGTVVATAIDPDPLASNLQIVLGQLYPKRAVRPFVGQIDEVAIYERALRDDELKRHFKLARPPFVFMNNKGDDSL